MSVPFVHLHVHTDYSLLDATQKCSAIAKAAASFGMPSVACTDHGNMSACMELTKACADAGIKPIYGCEFYVAPGACTVKDNTVPHYNGYHLVCLAETYEGYINMCHLNEEAWLHGYYYKPRVDKELLRKYHKGIIALSACLAGEVASRFLDGQDELAEDVADEYTEIFGPENFFLELQNHGLPEDKIVIPKIIELAHRKNLPLVATNDSHYLTREHAEAHEVFLCIGTQTTMKDEGRFKFPGGPEYYFKSADEMVALFPTVPEAIENTVKIAERCDHVHIPTVSKDKANHYPAFPLPENYQGTREDFLRALCAEGMKERYNIDISASSFTTEQQAKVDRMNYELGIIKQTGFTSYYLVVWDFLHFARMDGVPLGPGRGSGAGSIVAYLIHITDIDPIRYNLLFERFLNPERVSPPDFDIDLCERRRHRVIEYVHRRYGEGNVVQIGTFGTLKAKAVVKDVARALGRTFNEGNLVAKLIPADPKMTLAKARKINEELQNLIKNEPWVQELWHFAEILEGLNRNMSMHAAGVIICDTRVSNVCPISKGANDEPTTQFPASPDESLGLLKMDFLGLRNLTIIQDALDLIAKNRGVKMTSSEIPNDDKAAYELLNKGNTIGVFQLESTGMQDLCRRFGVSRLEDIIALIALYRPGPMQFVEDFINRKSGKVPVVYDVPEMAPILKETYGIMLYQEQVMQVAQAVAGFSLGQADILRRAMGKKDIQKMEMMYVKFQEGARAKGHDDAIIKQIWDKIYVFAGYGFNKSHSAAYGLLSYRTAYLKANYPAEFLAAVLTSELGNAEKMSFFLRECRKMGIKILPPDINICDAMFSVDGPNIRFGLAAIKGVGTAIVSSIIEARKDGPFKNISDFCERVPGNSKRLMECLIKAGAMDCFGLRRSQCLTMADEAIARAVDVIKDKNSGQLSLFDMFAPEDKAITELKPPELPEWPLRELLSFEKELLGFYVSGHPIGEYQDLVERYQSHDLSALASLRNGTTVRVGAYISAVSRKTTKKDGKPWVILNLESREAHLECLFFPEAYENAIADNKNAFTPESVVFIDGETSKRDEDEPMKLTGRIIYPAAEMPAKFTQEIQVKLNENELTPEKLTAIRSLTTANQGPIPLVFFLHCNDGNVAVLRDNEHGINYTENLWNQLSDTVGHANIFARVDKHPRPQRRRQFNHIANGN